jgi:regulator of sirC expression with transglutaminase-like and TPR domain
MIVKMRTKNGWKFTDNVKHFYSTDVSLKECNEIRKAYSFYNVYRFFEINEGTICIGKGANQEAVLPTLNELFFEFNSKDGSFSGSEIVLTDAETYLLNDEGKTIERIN